MRDGADTEIRRLERLHQGAELELLLLASRASLSPSEALLVREIEQRKEQLQGRIAWFESILREHGPRSD
jgi:hypothetical protein